MVTTAAISSDRHGGQNQPDPAAARVGRGSVGLGPVRVQQLQGDRDRPIGHLDRRSRRPGRSLRVERRGRGQVQHLQPVPELRRGRAAGRLVGHGVDQQLHEGPADVRNRLDRLVLAGQHISDGRAAGFRPAGRPARQQRVQRGRQGVHVTELGGRPALEGLRWCVRRSDGFDRITQFHTRIGHRGQPEVGESGVPVGVDQDVGRLDVAMQYAAGVRGRQCIGNPYADIADLVLGGSLLRPDPLGQRTPGTQLHHQEGPVVGQDAGVVHSDDARVPRHPARRPGFPQKTALLGLRIQGALINFHRDRSVQRLLPRLPDRGKAAPGQGAPIRQPRNLRWCDRHRPKIVAQHRAE